MIKSNIEIWRDIPGYEGLYQVSNLGNVKSVSRTVIRKNNIKHTLKGRKLKISKDRLGYLIVNLCKNNTKKTFKIHRIVLMAFKPVLGMENLQVNHKDEKRSNNNIDNLEWCTAKYNNNYGNHSKNMAVTQGRKIRCIETGAEFYSISECARKMKLGCGNISNHLKGNINYSHVGHYHFEYIN